MRIMFKKAIESQACDWDELHFVLGCIKLHFLLSSFLPVNNFYLNFRLLKLAVERLNAGIPTENSKQDTVASHLVEVSNR